MKLYALSVSVWGSDDYIPDRNTNPLMTEKYLFATEEEARKFAKEETDADDRYYNDGWLCTAEIDDKDILDLTSYDTIEDFADAMRGNLHEDEIAEWVIDNDKSGGDYVECNNYDFDKSLDGAILVVWSWQTYVGYARKIEELRYAYYGETERILTKRDKTFVSQIDVVMTAEEVAASTDLESDLIDELLANGNWKWTNPWKVERLIDEIIE